MKMKKKNEHYVDNAKFLEAMKEYKTLCEDAKKNDKDKPLVTNYIGGCFLKIANHLSYRPNFINYTYRDDMISDGIENCLQYLDNFDPEKSKNPFAYFTQIIYYAFIRRIQKEKKQVEIKQKLLHDSNFDDLALQPHDDSAYSNQFTEFLRNNQTVDEKPVEKKDKKRRNLKGKLDKFL
tara:strand:- start:1431 stop:1967 length:537 start_codon:yes stop_codon:yes gene_type:complete